MIIMLHNQKGQFYKKKIKKAKIDSNAKKPHCRLWAAYVLSIGVSCSWFGGHIF